MDAPNEASGPIPEDVKPYFDGPYYEWWNAEKVRLITYDNDSATNVMCRAIQTTEAPEITH